MSSSSTTPDPIPACHSPPPTKITVLISGNGSNLQALIDACSSGLLPSCRIIHVISNKKDAYGLTRARTASIRTSYHNLVSGNYLPKKGAPPLSSSEKQSAREKYDADLAKLVLDGPDAEDGKERPDLVVCAGWMHIVSKDFLRPMREAGVPVINLHPALPGKYDGADAIGRAWRDFEKGELERGASGKMRTGVMVHYVIEEVDRGEPIVVREVQVEEGTVEGEGKGRRIESLGDLEEAMHRVEHELIVTGTGLAVVKLWEERRERGEARK